MQYPKVKPHESKRPLPGGVYADLDELIRMQFKVHGVSFLPRQPVQSLLAGRRASRLRGRGLDFEEIRRYIPGDDIRGMDWRVTARTQKPHIRVYTEERDRPVLLVVDQRLSMFFGSQVALKSVTAAEVAAMGAWRTLSVGDRVGALVFNDSDIREMPPHRSRQRVMQILETVLEMNDALRVDGDIEPNPAMLNRVLERVLHLAKHDYLVAIISDFNGADEETKNAVTRLAAHNDVIALFIYDPLEARLPALEFKVEKNSGSHAEVFASSEEIEKQPSDEPKKPILDRLRPLLSWVPGILGIIVFLIAARRILSMKGISVRSWLAETRRRRADAEITYFKRFRKASLSNDARASLRELMHWLDRTNPRPVAPTLEQFARESGMTDLLKEEEALNGLLFARPKSDPLELQRGWSGRQFYTAVARARREQIRRTRRPQSKEEQILSLNPRGTNGEWQRLDTRLSMGLKRNRIA